MASHLFRAILDDDFAGKKDPKLFGGILKTFDFVQVKKLEAQGVPSKHAEAITAAITEVLNNSLVNVAHSFISKVETQKVGFIFIFLGSI